MSRKSRTATRTPAASPLLANAKLPGCAGRVLSEAVAALQLDQPVVVGVARGGVAVALEVARELEAPLTAIDVERVNACTGCASAP